MARAVFILALLIFSFALPAIAVSGVEANITTAAVQSPASPETASTQDAAPGKNSSVFTVPPQMRTRVDFWKNIYSKYTTHQVVLHDKDNLSLVYDVVDLDSTGKRGVRERKQKIESILKRLYDNQGNPTTSEEEAIAAKFANIPGNRKYLEAMDNMRAQLGQADRFKAGLQRSGRYLRYIKEVLRSYNLPEELAALPHVESSFNYKAYSFVGAAGVWQFMRSTGRLFMKVDYTIDERRDPIVSTDAAARLLRLNYNELGSWPLAITAYNHGLNGMRRAKQQHGDNIVEIINNYNSKAFGFASKNFYSEFLAALEVSRDYQKYFGKVDFEPEFRFDEVILPQSRPVNAIKASLKAPFEQIQEYNLALRPIVWKGKRPIPKGYRLRVPAGYGDQAAKLLAATPVETKFITQKTEKSGAMVAMNTVTSKTKSDAAPKTVAVEVAPSKEQNSVEVDKGDTTLEQESPDFHYVKQGETLYAIAKKYGTTVAKLSSLNGITKKSKLKAGQKLMLDNEREDAEAGPELPRVASAAPVAAPAKADDDTLASLDTNQSAFVAGAEQGVSSTQEGATLRIGGRTINVKASDYSVRMISSNTGEIRVRQDETLGHYADWLNVSRRAIQRMNKRHSLKTMKIGMALKIPLTKAGREKFERRRFEYHMGIMEDFFEEYTVEGEKKVPVAKNMALGDILSEDRNEAPVWLVRLYNPGVRFGKMKEGDSITIPQVVKKQ